MVRNVTERSVSVKRPLEIYLRLCQDGSMDTKEAGSRGGTKAWKSLGKSERSRIMSERQKKRWQRIKDAHIAQSRKLSEQAD